MKNYTAKWGRGNKDESDHCGGFHCRLEENLRNDVLSMVFSDVQCYVKHLFAFVFRFSPISLFLTLSCAIPRHAKKAAFIASGANSMQNRSGRVENM